VATGTEQRALTRVAAAVRQRQRAAQAVAWTVTGRVGVVAVGAHLPLVLLAITAPALVGRGIVSPGEVAGAVTYVAAALVPTLGMLATLVGGWLTELAAVLARLDGHLTDPPPHPQPVGLRPRGYQLVADNLWFSYGPHAEAVLRGCSLTVPEGEHLAIVGPSGAGKSSLAALLAGLQYPQRGQVRLGDCPLSGVDPGWLRRQVALIPQEAYVVAGTLRENLTYLAPDADDRVLDRVVVALGMRPLVQRLGGYQAGLGPGGVQLSAGERQLVALARVYASPARVVLLDEATSNLDPAAEATVEEAFARRGGTLIVVAHRISSARRAGRVVVVDGQGGLASGTNDEMLTRSARYAELVGYWDTGR
ncbi:MAG TPA: ABC transporter ATP-binding protein, partial [Pseudonocardiaceae bacterium]|nr:ABC transporter ATP-binding protein [Pseudonocardiaceae bacterium]